MTWVVLGALRYWVGMHPKLGLLVMPPDRVLSFEKKVVVELFIVSQKRVAEFKTSVARNAVDGDILEIDSLGAVGEYVSFIQSKTNGFTIDGGPSLRFSRSEFERETHCYQCRIHLSSRLSFICSGCDWIVCPACGACGCGYTKAT